MKKLMPVGFGLFLICQTSFASTCQVQSREGIDFGPLNLTVLSSQELNYSVAQETAPAESGAPQSFSARALRSTRPGYARYVDNNQSAALNFWGSWDAPDDKITYDVQESLLQGGAGKIEVWGVEAPEDNPTIDGTPALMATIECQAFIAL